MPIRIEHQPSPWAVGMAGYATGSGIRKQRQQKYNLDLLQQNMAIDARRQEQFAYENARTNRENSREANRAMQIGYGAAASSLADIPENAPPEIRKRLGNLRSGINDIVSGKYGYNPDVRE